jgi:hypothetical protein
MASSRGEEGRGRRFRRFARRAPDRVSSIDEPVFVEVASMQFRVEGPVNFDPREGMVVAEVSEERQYHFVQAADLERRIASELQVEVLDRLEPAFTADVEIRAGSLEVIVVIGSVYQALVKSREIVETLRWAFTETRSIIQRIFSAEGFHVEAVRGALWLGASLMAVEAGRGTISEAAFTTSERRLVFLYLAALNLALVTTLLVTLVALAFRLS